MREQEPAAQASRAGGGSDGMEHGAWRMEGESDFLADGGGLMWTNSVDRALRNVETLQGKEEGQDRAPK